MTTQALLQQAKAACPQLAWLGSEEKNRAILQMADAIEANADVILAANAEDLHAAQDVISSVMLDRLRLTGSPPWRTVCGRSRSSLTRLGKFWLR